MVFTQAQIKDIEDIAVEAVLSDDEFLEKVAKKAI